MYGENIMKKRIIAVLSLIIGVVVGQCIAQRNMFKKLEEAQMMSDKHLELFKVMTQWVKVKQEGKNIADVLKEEGYLKIAVYGMSYVGESLVNELKDTGVRVLYGIDKNVDRISSTVDIVSINDNLEPVDAIIVTAISFFDEINKELSKKIDCPIISLDDIIFIL